MELPPRVRGMQDIFGEYQRYFTFLKKVARHEFRTNGFTRITTPILEMKSLIVHSTGDSSDIVTKEMFDFTDKGGREVVMKPESTPGVMRAYLEHMLEEPQPVQLYYIEPHFRYDRPQKGRYRQFHQVGAEIIGEEDPILDAKAIYTMKNILDGLGLQGTYTIKINSLGITKEREKYLLELQSFFENKKHLLDEIDLARLEKNPLRLLDSKNPDVQELLKIAPKMTDFLKKDSLEFYNKVKEYLQILGVDYVEDHTLVRGLDYYSHTVWEFVDGSGRTQDAFGGGGRYDGLSKSIGWKNEIPAVGFAFGAERLIEAMMENGVKLRNKDQIHLYIMQLGDEAKKLALPLNIEARRKGINSLISLGTPSIKVQLKKANRVGARFVIVIGIMEAKKGICQLKDMNKGTQVEMPLDAVLDAVIAEIGQEALSFYHPSRDFIITDNAVSIEESKKITLD
ncbi:MAG: histidine--tRNA ligase [Candidatus Gracilibacteria bacterium]|nr:histidine--tRNA ligase [Candidatus Gracilibacteria bacterium]